MVQSENEYGSYAKQTQHTDTEYLLQMRNLLRKYLGSEILIYATDGCSSRDVLNSKTSGVFRLQKRFNKIIKAENFLEN